jgi:hypothetical protein
LYYLALFRSTTLFKAQFVGLVLLYMSIEVKVFSIEVNKKVVRPFRVVPPVQ